MTARDGHVRVLPLHVANKIAAGEVVERPASVVKELVENSLDAGARSVRVAVVQGGRKLVSVQDDGCGMSRDDAVLSLERQATSKILDVGDIEEIDTLGFRGEAIPSIASVSRMTITTRRRDEDEGTMVAVNAGTLAEVRSAGCPPGTLVEVRDLFCNVPARRKFLRAYATEEAHVKGVFTVHALAHPSVGFSLTVDGRELYRLAPAASLRERVADLFGPEFLENMLPLAPAEPGAAGPAVTGFIERPGLGQPTRRDQYVFVNGRPATSPSIAYALRESYPRRQGDARPAAIVFIDLPPKDVDVNVHPTKREVRFRDNVAVKRAIEAAVEGAVASRAAAILPRAVPEGASAPAAPAATPPIASTTSTPSPERAPSAPFASAANPPRTAPAESPKPETEFRPAAPRPVEAELPLASDGERAKPWSWFRFLAATASGYVIVETDSGVVTVNPHAARERIAFERLMAAEGRGASQDLLIPETVHLSPTDAARVAAALPEIRRTGFGIEEFGRDTFKIDAVPQLIGGMSPAAVVQTVARDLAESGSRRGGERWREELVARSIARSFAGMSLALNEEGAVKLIEELCACRMPYVCPRGKPIMIFTSTRELDRKFARE